MSDRLLKDEEMSRIVVEDFGYDLMPRNRAIAQAQLDKDLKWEAKTASIKDAECQEAKNKLTFELGKVASDACQERVEQMVGEIERALIPTYQIANPSKPNFYLREVVWQELKRKWGILPTKPKKPFSVGSGGDG